MTDIESKLVSAGYRFEGKTPYGDRYRRDGFTVYHSGFYLIFIRDGGMTRPFREDRLHYFSVRDMERQTSIDPNRITGKEDLTNYEIGRRF